MPPMRSSVALLSLFASLAGAMRLPIDLLHPKTRLNAVARATEIFGLGSFAFEGAEDAVASRSQGCRGRSDIGDQTVQQTIDLMMRSRKARAPQRADLCEAGGTTSIPARPTFVGFRLRLKPEARSLC